MNPGTKSTYEESLSNVLERTVKSLDTLISQSNIQKQLIQKQKEIISFYEKFLSEVVENQKKFQKIYPSDLERVQWEALMSSIETVLATKT